MDISYPKSLKIVVCIWELVSCHKMSQHKFCTCWITCWWSHVIMAATDDDSPIISLSNLNQQLSTALNHHHTDIKWMFDTETNSWFAADDVILWSVYLGLKQNQCPYIKVALRSFSCLSVPWLWKQCVFGLWYMADLQRNACTENTESKAQAPLRH